MIYCINLPLNLLQGCLSGTSIYQNIKNLLTLILMKTSVLFQNDRNFETFTKNHQILLNSNLKMFFCAVEVS